jgi:tRNA pseudouridine32 synthase/23S rRNA pseudouridine746 synthase
MGEAPVRPLPDVLYADAALVVLEKPAGLLCVPGRGADKQDCLSTRSQQLFPEALIVHRLDQATSGLVLMARGAEMQQRLSKAFAERAVYKRYVAVVQGQPQQRQQPWGLIDLPIAADWPRRPLRIIDPVVGKPSQTRWRIAEQPSGLADATRLELEPLTGRTHQLRVHLQALGHPILGDALYGTPQGQAMASRLLLHAELLKFPHPITGHPLELRSAAPF